MCVALQGAATIVVGMMRLFLGAASCGGWVAEEDEDACASFPSAAAGAPVPSTAMAAMAGGTSPPAVAAPAAQNMLERAEKRPNMFQKEAYFKSALTSVPAVDI